QLHTPCQIPLTPLCLLLLLAHLGDKRWDTAEGPRISRLTKRSCTSSPLYSCYNDLIECSQFRGLRVCRSRSRRLAPCAVRCGYTPNTLSQMGASTAACPQQPRIARSTLALPPTVEAGLTRIATPFAGTSFLVGAQLAVEPMRRGLPHRVCP
ncbi:unnamed protein product, partial [Ectocarpus sp. 12 AP-2014]